MEITTEEHKMLEFLRANGVTTLDQAKSIFNRVQNEKDESVEEEVVFVNEIPATRTISKEQLALLVEASTRYKEKLLNYLKKTEEPAEPAQPTMPRQIAQHTQTVVVNPGHNNVYADSSKNTTTLPMRYRHKHTQVSNQKGQRSQQSQARTRPYRQANNNIVPPYNQYHQCFETNMVSNFSYNNNTCGGYIYPIGNGNNMSVPITQNLPATPVFNPINTQQHDWTHPMMPNSSHSAYNFNNYSMAQMQGVYPQASMQEAQQPATQFLTGSRSIFDTS